jgi:hypothetical protein
MLNRIAEKGNDMMHVDDEISRQTRSTQRRIFRLARHNHGLVRKAISIDSGIPYSSLTGYANGSVLMPVTAVIRLAGVIPDDLLSQLFAPADRHLVPDEDDDSDLDDLGGVADEIASEVRKARHPKSPGGVEIIAIEEERIRRKAAELRRRVA